MNTIRYILTNPLGWGMAIVHWVVVAFALLGDRPSDPIFGVHTTTELMFYLALLDFPALLLTKFLISPFDPSISITPLTLLIPVGLATVQWLLVGAGFTKVYRVYRRDVPLDGDSSLKFR